MIIDHVYLAFLHQVELQKNWAGTARTSYEVADAMRQELSETCPEIIWQNKESNAYDFIQALILSAKNDLIGPETSPFTPEMIYINAICDARKALTRSG